MARYIVLVRDGPYFNSTQACGNGVLDCRGPHLVSESPAPFAYDLSERLAPFVGIGVSGGLSLSSDPGPVQNQGLKGSSPFHNPFPPVLRSHFGSWLHAPFGSQFIHCTLWVTMDAGRRNYC